MKENGVFIAYGISEIALTVFLYVMLCIKCRRPVTSIRQILMLPENYGIPKERCLSAMLYSISDIVSFSEEMQKFCLRQGIDPRRSFFAALCTEELAENVITHGFSNGKQTLSVRIFVEQDQTLTLRFRDDGRAFDLTRYWQLIEKKRKLLLMASGSGSYSDLRRKSVTMHPSE